MCSYVIQLHVLDNVQLTNQIPLGRLHFFLGKSLHVRKTEAMVRLGKPGMLADVLCPHHFLKKGPTEPSGCLGRGLSRSSSGAAAADESNSKVREGVGCNRPP